MVHKDTVHIFDEAYATSRQSLQGVLYSERSNMTMPQSDQTARANGTKS